MGVDTEKNLTKLEQKQVEVDSLMVWLGWNNAPFARELEDTEGVNLQAPMREASQLKKRVEEAKKLIKIEKKASVTIQLPTIYKQSREPQKGGLKMLKIKTRGTAIYNTILPSTRELFQKISEVLVGQFGFTVPETVESANNYPTNDPAVFVSLGDLSYRFEGKPLEDVSLVVGKTS